MESITCQKCGEVCDLAISTKDFSGRYVSTCCGAKYDYMLEVSDGYPKPKRQHGILQQVSLVVF